MHGTGVIDLLPLEVILQPEDRECVILEGDCKLSPALRVGKVQYDERRRGMQLLGECYSLLQGERGTEDEEFGEALFYHSHCVCGLREYQFLYVITMEELILHLRFY
jgi:hypothetical protein